jgi:hypothetical protein
MKAKADNHEAREGIAKFAKKITELFCALRGLSSRPSRFKVFTVAHGPWQRHVPEMR